MQRVKRSVNLGLVLLVVGAPLLAQNAPRTAGRTEIGRAVVQLCTAAAGNDANAVNSLIVTALRSPGILRGLQRECSVPGAMRVATQGQFGPAATVFGAQRVTNWAARAGLNPATCVAFSLPPAEVVACQDADGAFRFLRVDDIARL